MAYLAPLWINSPCTLCKLLIFQSWWASSVRGHSTLQMYLWLWYSNWLPFSRERCIGLITRKGRVEGVLLWMYWSVHLLKLKMAGVFEVYPSSITSTEWPSTARPMLNVATSLDCSNDYVSPRHVLPLPLPKAGPKIGSQRGNVKRQAWFFLTLQTVMTLLQLKGSKSRNPRPNKVQSENCLHVGLNKNLKHG